MVKKTWGKCWEKKNLLWLKKQLLPNLFCPAFFDWLHVNAHVAILGQTPGFVEYCFELIFLRKIHRFAEISTGAFDRVFFGLFLPIILRTIILKRLVSVFQAITVKCQEWTADSAKNTTKLVILVVGAGGRGPLVDCALNCLSATNIQNFVIFAVEKNPNAVVTMWHKQNSWGHFLAKCAWH